MNLIFKNRYFDLQFLRLISSTYTQGADIGPAFAVAHRIKEGDFDDWYAQWFNFAEKRFNDGLESEKGGHLVSACQAFLQASNYYRASYFFLRDNLQDLRLIEAFEKNQRSFKRALPFLELPVQALSIPYENILLPGYLFYGKGYEKARLPVVVYPCGMDSTKEEHYFSGIQGLQKRGYNVVVFEGPGQGEILFKHAVPFRHDYEVVLKAVIDFIECLEDVDTQKMALLGRSFGSYLCLRTAACDKRIKACIADPGHLDHFDSFVKRFPPPLQPSVKENKNRRVISFLLKMMSRNKNNRFILESRLPAFGVKDIFQFIDEIKKYTLKEVAGSITCPVLVCEAENEPFAMNQGRQLYAALKCPKTFIRFTNEEGAGEHCELGATALFEQRAFNWLDKLLKI
jgi:predicted alpha/beta-fold hydrolase